MTTVVCRCEDITEDDILEAIRDGYREIEVIKRHLRLGMGPCQGKTCIPIIERIVARETGCKTQELDIPTARPPSRQVSFSLLAGDDRD